MSGMWRNGQHERLLVCLDLQRGAIAPGEAPDRCVVNCRRVLAHAREAGWRIVHVHCRKADSGEARPIAGLEPLTSEAVVYRTAGSAFSSPAFRRLVAGMAGCELVIIGYSVNASCLATALVAHDEDLDATLVADAICGASLDRETRDALELLTRQVAGRFIGLASCDSLTGAPRLLRAV